MSTDVGPKAVPLEKPVGHKDETEILITRLRNHVILKEQAQRLEDQQKLQR